MTINQLTGITLLLTLVIGVLLLPTAPPPTNQNSDQLTQQERYKQICGQDTTSRQDTPHSTTADEAPPNPIQFRNQSCTITNTSVTIQVTLKNTGTFISKTGPGTFTAGIELDQGATSFTVDVSPTHLQNLPDSADLRGVHHNRTNITLVNMTGSLQCPNNHITLRFSVPRTTNTTSYPNGILYTRPGTGWIEDSLTCTQQ